MKERASQVATLELLGWGSIRDHEKGGTYCCCIGLRNNQGLRPTREDSNNMYWPDDQVWAGDMKVPSQACCKLALYGQSCTLVPLLAIVFKSASKQR